MKSVVFDVGNVLIHWDAKRVFRDHFESDKAVDAFFKEIGFAEWNLSLDRGRDWDEAVETLCAEHPHHADNIIRFRDNWHQSVSGEISTSVAALNSLRKAGVPTYAITNFSSSRWLESQERFPFLKSHFVDVIVSGDEKLVKPGKEVFELFLKRNDQKAAKCIFIDDSAANIRTASKMGFETIHFTPGTDLTKWFDEQGMAA
ncbi:MAG: HAD family phosphatase [Pseudomonadota bacterium]